MSQEEEHHEGSARYRARRSVDICTDVSLQRIQQVSLFRGRTMRFIKQVADYLQLELFTEGAYLMKQGTKGNKMYFLNRGRVALLVGPQESYLKALESGSAFGEMALLGAKKRNASIKALEFCDCRTLDIFMFQMLLRNNPAERKAFEAIAKAKQEELDGFKNAEKPKPKSQFTRRSAHCVARYSCDASEDSNAKHEIPKPNILYFYGKPVKPSTLPPLRRHSAPAQPSQAILDTSGRDSGLSSKNSPELGYDKSRKLYTCSLPTSRADLATSEPPKRQPVLAEERNHLHDYKRMLVASMKAANDTLRVGVCDLQASLASKLPAL